VLAGHYSSAFVAKAAAPRAPLWALVIAAQFVDVLWALFVLAGVEHLRIDPALPSNPLDLYDMPYTHSLVGALGWAGVAAAGALFAWRSAGVAAAVGATVASHWGLDLLVHRPDLALWPGSPKLGLALWNRPAAALALELALLLGSAWLLAPRVPWRRGLWLFAGGLAAIQLIVTISPPSLGPTGVTATALALFLGAGLAAARVEGAVR
jgi:hypothetical protein